MSDRTETEETGAGIIAEMRGGPIPRHQHDRELLHHYADRLEAALARECGDVAKLREALEKIAHYTDNRDAMDDPGCADGHILADIAKTALAAPPRNCDVGTAEEQLKRFKDFCRIISKDETCDGCPLFPQCSTLEHCTLAWAQMPYEEGKNDGSK